MTEAILPERDATRWAGAETGEILAGLTAHEPAALHSQLPVVWARAEGTKIWGVDGDEWLDWTSGILAANLGHAPRPVTDAIIHELRAPLLHSYGFATRIRAQMVELLTRTTGFPYTVLTTTGAEAVEVAIKLCRSRARRLGRVQAAVVSFTGAFHGRTAGAQLAGGIPAQKHWTPATGSEFIQLPYPATPGSRCDIETLNPSDVACVIVEPYQGSTMRAIDATAALAIERWCRASDVPLVVDEIQSGFGRTGLLFAYERWNGAPDLLLVGKGLASGLPVAAVLYQDRELDSDMRPGELTTTHGGNPLALAAAYATLQMFTRDGVLNRVPDIADGLSNLLGRLRERWPNRIGFSACYGAVAGFEVVDANGLPDAAGAWQFVAACARRGLLLLAPVGPGRNLVKCAPPLVSTATEINAAVEVAYESASEVYGVVD